jgi:hypothetical protein
VVAVNLVRYVVVLTSATKGRLYDSDGRIGRATLIDGVWVGDEAGRLESFEMVTIKAGFCRIGERRRRLEALGLRAPRALKVKGTHL